MRAVCIDDEKLVLEDIMETLKRTDRFSKVTGFTNAMKGLEFIIDNSIEIVFLDIMMSGIDGMELAKRIKLQLPHTFVIFITGYSEYALEAINLHAFGYLLKPVTAASVIEQLDYIHCLMSPAVKCTKRYRIRAFGNFEFYIDEKMVSFSCAKAKELLAYLVDRRGAAVTVGEAAVVIFENRKNEISAKSGVRNALSDLMKILRREGADKLIIKKRSTIALNISDIDCDYYSMLEGECVGLSTYTGEYMAQYSWAEVTLAGIESMRRTLIN